ncbi:polysaccharide biosynthesis tyrosine autokinase [Allorhizobium undicola]|uniref:polysaccharide biosynthesis tyrosine autokinase n=1 Tax=Allorhizobium undicola TaxID=78527 RepID=UPI00047F0ACA|nr:polysaccharide biosynthesis tyrosine autokinase [Allorhizobium undicola]
MNERSLPLKAVLHREQSDSDSFIDLDKLFAAAARRIRIVTLSVALFIMLGISYLVFATPFYTSATQILLDNDLSRYAEDEKAGVQLRQEADTQIASAVEILKSNSMALRVVDDAKLADNDLIVDPPQSPLALAKGFVSSLKSIFSSAPQLTEEQIRNARRKLAAARLQQAVDVERVLRSSVIMVSFKSPDPQLSAQVTRAYADAFLTDQLNANFDASERASLWLQGRLDDLAKRAQQAALEAEHYKAENGLTQMGGELMSEQQLSDLNKQLIVAQADSASASARYQQYKSITDQGPQNAVKNAVVSVQAGGNPVLQDLRTKYLTVEKREQDVTASFGATHPQAVALKAEKERIGDQIYQELQQLTSSFRNEFDVARSREKSLTDSIDRLTGKNSEANRSLVHLRELEQKATALKGLYESFLNRFEVASQSQSLPIAKARVISEAGVPTQPSSPKKTMVLALSAVLGLMAGAGLAFLQEMLERFFRLESDVRTVLGQKSLGYLPRMGPKTKTPLKRGFFNKQKRPAAPAPQGPGLDRMMRTVMEAPRSAFAETLRNTKLAADIILQGKSSRVIGVLSALPGEGKSTVAANFAVLLASSGKRTLLIDADLRNPSLSRQLQPAPRVGLVQAVLGETPWQECIKVDQETKLAILPIVPGAAARSLAHTNELIASPGMVSLIEAAKQSFDYVVVDLAPLGPVVDAKAFAPLADGFVFVVEWGKTPTKLVADLLDAEPHISNKVLGVLLNKTDMQMLTRYSDFGGSEKFRKQYNKYYVE